MRHNVAGKKLGRDTGHRKALFKNLLIAIFERDAIQTTLAKAKAVQAKAEKLITLAKGATEATMFDRRARAFRILQQKAVVKRLFETVAPRFRGSKDSADRKERKGGYTRILKLGTRIGDGAEMAQLELMPKS